MTEFSPLPVTMTLTGSLLLLLVLLSAMVTARRAKLGGVQFGDNGDDDLRARIRAHGNLVEIAPMVVLGIGLMEYAGASPTLLWWFAVIFFLGRLLHAARMYIGNPFIGLFSIISQHIICIWSGLWLLNHYFLVP